MKSAENNPGILLFVGIEGPQLSREERRFIAKSQPGGFILFARNLETPRQTNELLRSVQALAQEPCFFSIDQEGGRVDRLKKYFPPTPNLLRSASNGLTAVKQHARLTARALKAIGFNMNFAPVLDLLAPFHNGIEDRCFDSNPRKVAAFGVAYLKESRRLGIPGTLKHFPGIGRGECDSHVDLPVIPLHRKTLHLEDLLPFKRCFKYSPFVMIAHAFYPDLEDCYERPMPASLSRNIVMDLLRDDLGFRGLALTDDLLMGALKGFGDMEKLCEHAVLAGEDMLLICRGLESMELAYRFLASKRKSILIKKRIVESQGRIRCIKKELGLRTAVPSLDETALAQAASGMEKFAASVLAGGSS